MLRNKWLKKICVCMLAVVSIGIIATGCSSDGKTDTTSQQASTPAPSSKTKKEEPKKEEPKKEDTKVSYENFIKVSMGSSYDDVKALLGDGKEMSSSEIAGIKTVMYTWNGSGISNMNVTVQNGEITSKAQIGLKKSDAQMTLDKYNQVKEGMTYDEVKAIAGEGEITSHAKIMDMETVMYSWTNKDGANMTGTFTAGKLDMKAQFNLK